MTINLALAERLNIWIHRFLAYAGFALCVFIVLVFVNEALLDFPGVNIILALGPISAVVAILLMIFLANALGRFGPKYLLLILLLPLLGFLYSYFRLKGHLQQARLHGVGSNRNE